MSEHDILILGEEHAKDRRKIERQTIAEERRAAPIDAESVVRPEERACLVKRIVAPVSPAAARANTYPETAPAMPKPIKTSTGPSVPFKIACMIWMLALYCIRSCPMKELFVASTRA